MASSATSGSVIEYRTDSPEESVEFCRSYIDLKRLTCLGRSEKSFHYRYRLLSLGPIDIAEIFYREDVRVDLVENAPKYRVTLPMDGAIEYKHRSVEDAADSASAAIFSPGDPVTVKRWPGGTHALAVKLDSAVVEGALSGMIDAPITEPIEFSPTLATDAEPAASWMSLAANVGHASELLGNPLVAAPFADSLARGLLLASRHPYNRQLDRAVSLPRSPIVRAAVDYIEGNAGTPLTVSGIASHCHVSARALQLAFKRHMGMSPMAYVRRVRLRNVHADLRSADEQGITVASVAHKWGFTHLGRLAAEYRSLYGRLPHETLRLPQ